MGAELCSMASALPTVYNDIHTCVPTRAEWQDMTDNAASVALDTLKGWVEPAKKVYCAVVVVLSHEEKDQYRTWLEEQWTQHHGKGVYALLRGPARQPAFTVIGRMGHCARHAP